MLTRPTSARLAGMARAPDEQLRAGPTFEALGFEDRPGSRVDRGEPDQKTIRGIVFPANAGRDTRRLTARLRFAALRQAATVEDPDPRTPRGIDRGVMAHLIEGGWIARARRHKARRDGHSVAYHSAFSRHSPWPG